MKTYQISKHEVEKENGEVVREILTLEVTYANGSTSLHGKEIPVGSDIKEEAVTFAAKLEKVLQEPKEIVREEKEILEKNKEVSKLEVDAKVAEIEAEKLLEVSNIKLDII